MIIVGLIIQVSYEIFGRKTIEPSKLRDQTRKLIHKKYQIYISGCCNLNGFENQKFSEWLDIR